MTVGGGKCKIVFNPSSVSVDAGGEFFKWDLNLPFGLALPTKLDNGRTF